jgi:signal transduction histidine kinase
MRDPQSGLALRLDPARRLAVPEGEDDAVSVLAGRASIAIGAVLLCVALLSSEQQGRLLLGLAGAGAVAAGVLFVRWPGVVPLPVMDLMLVAVQGGLVAVARYEGPLQETFAGLYLVVGTVLFAVRPWRVIFVHVTLLAASYAGVLTVGHTGFAPATQWIVVMAVIISVGLFVRWHVHAVVTVAEHERAGRREVEAASAALEGENRAKTDFLARMNHELRTPLNAILGFSHILGRETSMNERQQDCVRDIGDSARHLVALVDEALDVDQIESGDVRLVIGKVHVRRLLDDSLVFVRQQAALKKVRIDVHVSGDVDLVLADAGKVRQVLVNLLANAVRFTPPGGDVVVRVTRSGRATCFAIEDSGPGVPEKDRERIFMAFEQSGRAGEGTGLGLPLSRRFVELHGGSLKLRSRDGGGCVFEFDLPDRPAVRSSDVDRPAETEVAADDTASSPAFAATALARTLAVAAVIMFLISVITPFTIGGRLVAAGCAAASAVSAWWVSSRAQRASFLRLEIDGLIAVVAVAVTISQTRELDDIIPIAYGGIAAVSFALWPIAAALRQFAAIAISYAIALTVVGEPAPIISWMTIVTLLAFTAEIVSGVSRRVRALAAAERAAHLAALQLRSDLAKTSKHKAAFVANMSHELRTPLNAIIGFSDLLALELVGPLTDKQREYIGDIQSAARQLLAIITDVLDTARLEAGQLKLDITDVDARLLLALVVDEAVPPEDRTRIEVAIDVDPRTATVRGDEQRLRQVLVELVGNAVKFMPDPGRIEIAVRPNGGAVHITVTDHGIGILPDQIGRVFEAFHQGTRLPADFTATGTGLGLSLAKSIVELHDGHIWVTSVPDRGSTFTVALPAPVVLASETASHP